LQDHARFVQTEEGGRRALVLEQLVVAEVDHPDAETLSTPARSTTEETPYLLLDGDDGRLLLVGQRQL
jgi:hypothetical protein